RQGKRRSSLRLEHLDSYARPIAKDVVEERPNTREGGDYGGVDSEVDPHVALREVAHALMLARRTDEEWFSPAVRLGAAARMLVECAGMGTPPSVKRLS